MTGKKQSKTRVSKVRKSKGRVFSTMRIASLMIDEVN